MIELRFSVESAHPRPFSAAPELGLRLRIEAPAGETLHAMLLRCQVQIDAARRRYDDREAAALRDLFGEPSRFAHTLRPLAWAQPGLMVGTFSGATTVELPLPCSFDFALAATKYLHGLDSGDAPLTLLFSGTVFRQTAGGLEVALVPSTAEARFALPAAVWKETMALHYPNWTPLALGRAVFDRLYRFKQESELRTFDEAIERLLARGPAS